MSEDVTNTGILLHSPQEQRVGDFLDLHLHTAKGRFHTTGIVVWTGSAEREGGMSNALGWPSPVGCRSPSLELSAPGAYALFSPIRIGWRPSCAACRAWSLVGVRS